MSSVPPPPGSNVPPPPPGTGTPPPPSGPGTPLLPPGVASTPPPPPPPPGAYAPRAPLGPGDLARPLAGFGVRLGGWLLDGLLYGLLMAVFAVPGWVMIIAAFDECVSLDDEIICPDGEPDVGLLIAGGVLALVGFLVIAAVYLRALGRTGQTWGRRIVGIKVIDATRGTPIGFGRALGRQLFEGIISSSIFYLGYLWMLWDDRNQTWHDKVVGSVVVQV